MTEKAVSCWASVTVITLYSHLLLHTHLLLLLFSFFPLAFLTEMRRKASPWQRNLGYPLAMLVLLALTVLAVLFMYFIIILSISFISFINENGCFNCCVFVVHAFSGDVCTDGLFQCVGVAPGRDGYASRNGGEDLARKNISCLVCHSQTSVFTDDCYFCAI